MATKAANNSKSPASVSAKDIEAGIEQVKADLSVLTETLGAYGKGKTDVIKGTLSEKSEVALKSTEEKLEELQAQLGDLSGKLEDQVRQKPIQSLAIAAGIGAFIAFLARK